MSIVNSAKSQSIACIQGRPYLEKMRWDKTEMLYWLQEERKEKALGLYNSLALKKQELVIPALLTPQS